MVAVKTYHVLARREGDAWTATVTNADGAHTWGQGLRHLHQSVREAIALAEDIDDEDSFDLDWEYVTGDPTLDAEARNLRERRREIVSATAELTSATDILVQQLRAQGYSVRDAAVIAGISAARAGQLAQAK